MAQTPEKPRGPRRKATVIDLGPDAVRETIAPPPFEPDAATPAAPEAQADVAPRDDATKDDAFQDDGLRDAAVSTSTPETPVPEVAHQEAPPQDPAPQGPVARETAATDAAPEAAGSGREETAAGPTPPPPSRTSPQNPPRAPRSGLLPGALGGGVAGAVGAALVLLAAYAMGLPGRGESDLAARLAALEARPQPPIDLTPPVDPAALATRLDAIEGRLGALAEAGNADAALRAEVDRLAGAVEAARASGGTLAADLAALRERIETLAVEGVGGGIDGAALAGIADRLGAVETRLREAPPPPDLGPLEARVADVAARLDAIAPKAEAAASAAQSAAAEATAATARQQALARAARYGAIEALARKVASGAPFAAEIETLRGIDVAGPAVEALAAHAAAGAATRSALVAEFASVAEAMATTVAQPPADQGILGGLIGSAGGLIEVRPVDGPVAGELGPLALAVRDAISAGRFAEAAAALRGAPPAALAIAEPFLARLDLRAGIEAALGDLLAGA
jgi:hypothetical protein